MAFVDIEVPEGDNATFFKFNAIGDVFRGIYVGTRMGKEGSYNGKVIEAKLGYEFRTREGNQVIEGPTNIIRGLEAALKNGLKPGNKVQATYTSDLPATKPGNSPMKIIKLQVDFSAAPVPAAPPAGPAARPAAAPSNVETPAQKKARLTAELAAASVGDEFDDIPL